MKRAKLRAGLSVGVLLALCAPSGGCGGSANSLTGSVSEVYSLDFDTVVIDLIGGFLVIEYDKTTGSADTQGKAVKLSVDLTNITVAAGTAIDLGAMINGGTRGTLEQIEQATVELGIASGTLTPDQAATAGQTLSGHFVTTLSDPSGRTLNGTFSALVKQL